MKKVALHSLGCKVNAYETEAMAQLFRKEGYETVPFEEGKADIYIINTCTVTNIADRKSRQMLHKAKKANPESLVVAVGCYAQAFYENLKKDEAIDLIVGNDQKKKIVEMVEQRLLSNGTNEKLMDTTGSGRYGVYEELTIDGMDEKTRAYLKIQDGCNQFCSYCIIPYARGRVRSRKPENIVEEVDRLLENGYQEIVLTGIHLSSYGIDLEKEHSCSLAEIVMELGKREKLKRLRLGSLEPRIITRTFLEQMKTTDSFCPHFHLSLQSGCDATLKRMNRRYTTEEFRKGCELIREIFPDAALTTDVIVGFPGETEEEFEQCVRFLEEIRFAKMHIFKYSRRQGTRAAEMNGQVDDQIKSLRSNRLLQLNERFEREYHEKFLGKCINVLFEEKIELEGETYFAGYTKEYMRVAVKTDEELSNRLLPVTACKLLNHEIILANF